MKNYSKEYLKTVEFTKAKKLFSYYESEEIINKLNEIVSDLKQKEQECLEEVKDCENENNFPVKFKHLGAALASSIVVLSASVLAKNNGFDLEVVRLVNELSTIASSMLLPCTTALGVIELANKITEQENKRELKRIEKHKSFIKGLQIIYKPYIPDLHQRLEKLYDEETIEL